MIHSHIIVLLILYTIEIWLWLAGWTFRQHKKSRTELGQSPKYTISAWRAVQIYYICQIVSKRKDFSTQESQYQYLTLPSPLSGESNSCRMRPKMLLLAQICVFQARLLHKLCPSSSFPWHWELVRRANGPFACKKFPPFDTQWVSHLRPCQLGRTIYITLTTFCEVIIITLLWLPGVLLILLI